VSSRPPTPARTPSPATQAAATHPAGPGTHAVPAKDACSVGFDVAGLSAYGTAARARFFVAVEQAGPWGRDAATQSHLAPDVGRALSVACADRGGRLSLIRTPGPHADDHHATGHTAYLAWSGPAPWLLVVRVAAPAQLLSADLDALARGDRDAVARSLPGVTASEPVLLVCTNGRRDVCCAVRGRPVALAAAVAVPGRVWEASHTGGHRFAPTAVLLPHGATFARLDADACVELLATADRGEAPPRLLGPTHDRGLSALEPAAQAAQAHVRHVLGATPFDAVRCGPLEVDFDGSVRVAVEHRDGRRWTVECRREPRAFLPESCGKAPVEAFGWVAVLVT
jgi:hypothetical protein